MRGKQAKRRELKPDALHNSELVTKFINYIMQNGRKTTAEKIVYSALDSLSQKTKLGPVEALERVVSNIKPKLEVRSRRVGGANYQVPIPVLEERQLTLALRWIVSSVRENRGSKPFSERLAEELAAAFKKEGEAFKKKEDTHKMAEANKAFSHLNW